MWEQTFDEETMARLFSHKYASAVPVKIRQKPLMIACERVAYAPKCAQQRQFVRKWHNAG